MSFNIEKFTEDVNVHQSLDDQPSLTASELKKKWDEPVNKIKFYLNNTLIPKIETEVPKEIAEQIKTAIKEVTDELEKTKKAVSDSLEAMEKSINEALTNGLKKVTSSEDFELTLDNQVLLTTNYQYGEVKKTATFQKKGYKPLGVVGYVCPAGNGGWGLHECYASKLGEESIDVYIRGNPGAAAGNIQYSTTVRVHILWVKIK